MSESEIHRSVELEGERTFAVVLGDITKEPVHAIVNAANGQLSHGGGVAAVISRAAGEALDRESKEHVQEHGPVPTGEAVTTTGGELRHEGVIHAVGPRQGEGDEEEKLTSAVADALLQTHRNGWRSVSFPAISAGIFSVPHDVCARAYVAGVKRHFELYPTSSVEDVRLCLFDPPDSLLAAVDEELEAGF